MFRVLGLVLLLAPIVLLGMSGSLSYLALDERPIEITYQVLGFALSAAAIGLGVARRWPQIAYTGTVFFVGYSRRSQDPTAFGFSDVQTQSEGLFIKLSYRFRM